MRKVFFLLLLISCGKSDKLKLFDGNSLEGWEGSNKIFKVKNNSIVGGSLINPIDISYYLCTIEKYENFELAYNYARGFIKTGAPYKHLLKIQNVQ